MISYPADIRLYAVRLKERNPPAGVLPSRVTKIVGASCRPEALAHAAKAWPNYIAVGMRAHE